MDKITKFLRALNTKERTAMMLLLEQLLKDYKKVPGIQSVKGKQYWYRVHLGMYRIIFSVNNKKVAIQKITKRNEGTYKNL